MVKVSGGKSATKEDAAKAPTGSSLADYAQKPAEMLLVGTASADPYSTSVVDPRTGVSAWSYKGSELQGAAAGSVAPLGQSGEYLIVSIKDRPLVHCLAVHNRDRFHLKSVVAGSISSFCSSGDGSLFFAAINNQVFVWLLTTGELLSVTDAHYQQIARIALSDDESILVSASNDGAVHAYLVSELVSADRERNVAPLRKWRAHTLAVKGLSVSHGKEPRIASCGLDHVATIHSISLDSCLLKISADRPLTACALDPAESRLFIGSDVGNIAQINLYDGTNVDLLVQTADERNSAVPVFNGHADEISALAVSGDGALLASGDVSGKYCLWEIASRQCLRVGRDKVSTTRGPISTLCFVPNWPTLSSADHTAIWRPAFDLQRNPTTGAKVQLSVRRKGDYDKQKWSALTDRLLNSAGVSSTKTAVKADIPIPVENGEKKEEEAKPSSSQWTGLTDKDRELQQRLQKLVADNAKLRKINADLYAFSAKQILNDGK